MNSRSCASRGTVKCTKKQIRSNGIEMSPLDEVNEAKPVTHIGRFKFWAQSITSLMAELCFNKYKQIFFISST